MKFLILFVCCILLAGPTEAHGQSIIPPIKSSGYSLRAYGAAQGVWLESAAPKIAWRSCRLYLDGKTTSPWSLFAELELRDALVENKNWVRRAEIVYMINKAWKVRGGRLFLAPSYITPAAMNLETIQYPRSRFGTYGTGFQAEGVFEGWRLRADVTGKAGVAFDSHENWESMAISARLERRFSDRFSVAGSVQFGADHQRLALDCARRQDRIYVKGAAYASFENSDYHGGYAFLGYRIFKYLELHTQVDGQHDSVAGDHVNWTNGARLLTINDQASLTIDHEHVVDGAGDDRFLARLQCKF